MLHGGMYRGQLLTLVEVLKLQRLSRYTGKKWQGYMFSSTQCLTVMEPNALIVSGD